MYITGKKKYMPCVTSYVILIKREKVIEVPRLLQQFHSIF